jgi:SAM-dependent methyltransferase
MIDSPVEYSRMVAVESDLWWYKALHRHVLKVVDCHSLKRSSKNILDAGCGTGGMMRFLRNAGYTSIEGFDLSDTAIAHSSLSGLNVWKGDIVMDESYSFGCGIYDVIISLDVLYFLSEFEQKLLIGRCYQRLSDGGILILNLPALACFSGIHDRAVGIKKRFSKKQMPTLIFQTGFKIEEIKYWPFFISPIIYLVRFCQRLRMYMWKFFGTSGKISSDLNTPPSLINKLLFVLTEWEVNHFSKWSPWGSSLFVVLRK